MGTRADRTVSCNKRQRWNKAGVIPRARHSLTHTKDHKSTLFAHWHTVIDIVLGWHPFDCLQVMQTVQPGHHMLNPPNPWREWSLSVALWRALCSFTRLSRNMDFKMSPKLPNQLKGNRRCMALVGRCDYLLGKKDATEYNGDMKARVHSSHFM